MADIRTRAEWENLVATEALSNGVSTSSVAAWLDFRDAAITLSIDTESIVHNLKSDIDIALATKQPGSIYSYPSIMKAFQNGDSLTVTDDGIVAYASIDTAKQIIKQATVRETADGKLVIKVAKDDGSGGYTNLSSTERDNAQAYFEARRGPGVKGVVQSYAADSVKYTINGVFDPLYAKTDVEAGLNAALTDFQANFRFDAVFYKSILFEKLMSVTGMLSLELVIDMSFSNGNSITNLPDNGNTELPAGYFNYDNTSTINLIPA